MEEDSLIIPPVVDGGDTFVTNEYYCGCVQSDYSEDIFAMSSRLEEFQFSYYENLKLNEERWEIFVELMDVTLVLLNVFLHLGVGFLACLTAYILVKCLYRFIFSFI